MLPPRTHFGLGGIMAFWAQKLDKKNWQNSQRFWTTSMFHVLNYSNIFPKYTLFTKRIETCWSRDISTFSIITSVKFFLIYILRHNVSKNQMKKTISSLHVSKSANTYKLYTLKALLSKNWFYCFFLVFWHAKIPPSFGMPRYWH